MFAYLKTLASRLTAPVSDQSDNERIIRTLNEVLAEYDAELNHLRRVYRSNMGILLMAAGGEVTVSQDLIGAVGDGKGVFFDVTTNEDTTVTISLRDDDGDREGDGEGEEG